MRPTLSFGSSGPAVVEAQSKLNKGVSSLARLDEDGGFGPLTASRVREFQMQKQLGVDGVVGPITWGALDALGNEGVLTTPIGIPPQVIEAPAGPVAGSLRQRIIDIAIAEATPEPGRVSDLDVIIEDGETVRRGWRRLKQYFDEGVEGWNESRWNSATLKGVRKPGAWLPGHISWCGIFATWVLQQAGLPVKWRVGQGITVLQKIGGSQGLQAGDVAILKGEKVHHFVVAGIDGKIVRSVNGNSDAQSILIKQNRLDEIWYYYRAQ